MNYFKHAVKSPRLSPEDCWDRLQPTRDPTEGLSGRKWMDGCCEVKYILNLSTAFEQQIINDNKLIMSKHE